MSPIEASIILFVVIGFIIGVILMFSSAFGLFLIQYTQGITEEQRQANREKYAGLIEEDIKKQENSTEDNSITDCVDQNLCGTPSPWYTDRRTVESTTSAGLTNSLGELESQVKNNANYRAELINYINAHGLRDDMQQSGLFPGMLNTFQLERLVKAHMTECLSTSTPTSGFC